MQAVGIWRGSVSGVAWRAGRKCCLWLPGSEVSGLGLCICNQPRRYPRCRCADRLLPRSALSRPPLRLPLTDQRVLSCPVVTTGLDLHPLHTDTVSSRFGADSRDFARRKGWQVSARRALWPETQPRAWFQHWTRPPSRMWFHFATSSIAVPVRELVGKEALPHTRSVAPALTWEAGGT